MDSAEFSEWIAYYNIEPFGDQWGDYRAGVVAASLKNSWRSEDTPAFKPGDFFWTLNDQQTVPTVDSESDRVRAVMENVRQRMLASGKYAEATPPPAT